MELGLITFADVGSVSPEQRLKNLLEEAELADQLGLDVFGVGEHHRPDFAVSSPAVALAAIAARDRADPPGQRGHACSAPTIPCACSSSSPHVDLLSGGRAEIMAGRGSFTESFPLFGYDLDDYDELFAEKLELLLELRERSASRGRAATARRSTTPACGRARSRTRSRSGSRSAARPQSVVRAGVLGLPLTIAIIGGQPERFVAARRSLPPRRRAGRPRPGDAPLGINTHAFVGDTSAKPTRVRPPYLR